MAEFIRIREWSKYQHYKDRNPPWIKLYREMTSSRFWVECSDASRVLAIASMVLASCTDNKIPASKVYIRRVAYLNQDPDFAELVDTQFVEIIDDTGKILNHASILLAPCKQNAIPETETETETEKIKPSAQKPRGPKPNSQMAKASGETRHSRLQGMIMTWYQEWAGVQCPWNGAEGKQLQALIKSTPDWPDQNFVTCLINLGKSPEYVPQGSSPHEWLSKIPKFLKGPLDRYGRPSDKAVAPAVVSSKAADDELKRQGLIR